MRRIALLATILLASSPAISFGRALTDQSLGNQSAFFLGKCGVQVD